MPSANVFADELTTVADPAERDWPTASSDAVARRRSYMPSSSP